MTPVVVGEGTPAPIGGIGIDGVIGREPWGTQIGPNLGVGALSAHAEKSSGGKSQKSGHVHLLPHHGKMVSYYDKLRISL